MTIPHGCSTWSIVPLAHPKPISRVRSPVPKAIMTVAATLTSHGGVMSSTPTPGTDKRPLYPEYGRLSADGVCPGTYAGLPCEVIVTVSDVKPGEVAVMTLVPE